MWNTNEAIELCKRLEPIAAQFKCHVALTGGLLYKDGPRKDCDIIVYKEKFDVLLDRDGLLAAFAAVDLIEQVTWPRVTKATYLGAHVDLIFPEEDGEYIAGEEAKEEVALALLEQSN
jgi:hypothetical protein